MPRKKRLLRLKEAADMLGVNPETLRRWDNAGVMKAIRVGNRGDRRYRAEDIEKKIKQKKIG